MVARDHLPTACSRWLTRLLDADDTSVWLIRQLDLELAVDVGNLDNDALADAWGRHMAQCIVRTLVEGTDIGDTVMHFSNRAAYVAQFVADLAEGKAWNRWYYRFFDALGGLPTGTAVRTVLTRNPEQIGEILVHLSTQRRLESVLNSMNEADADILYEQLLAFDGVHGQSMNAYIFRTDTVAADATDTRQPTERLLDGGDNQAKSIYMFQAGADERQLVELLLSLWSTASLQLFCLTTAHNALRLYTAICVRQAGNLSRSVHSVINALLHFAEVLRIVAQPGKLITCLASDNLTGALQLLHSGTLQPLDSGRKIRYLESLSLLQQMATGDSAFIRRIAHTVATSIDIARDQAMADKQKGIGIGRQSERVSTLLGGIFLLLPTWLDLRLHELITSVPYSHLQETSSAQILRYLLSLKCFAPLYAQWQGIMHDPMLSFAAGLAEAPSIEAIQHYSQSITEKMNLSCLRLLVERLARFNYIDGRCLYAELVDTSSPGDKILLLRDMLYDNWVYATSISRDDDAIQDALIRGLAWVQEATNVPIEYVVFAPGWSLDQDVLSQKHIQVVWTEQAPSSFPHLLEMSDTEEPVTVWTTEQQALSEHVSTLLKRYLKRVRPATRDLAYLTLTDCKQPLIKNRDLDLTWSLVAHALLKTFARRLIGFDWSSLEYLYHNFLAGTSMVQLQHDLVEVQLPCSPLHLVLRMAGMDGQTYTLPWQDDAQIMLVLMC
jgi:hypothetical protein